jgi:SprT-like family
MPPPRRCTHELRSYHQNKEESIMASKSYHRDAITPIEYSGLQDAYDHFNAQLFGGSLPDVFITYQRKAHSHGYFAPDRFSGRVDDESGRHELALNPDSFINQTDEQVCQTLNHEMVHVWQHVEGKPSARGYHNKEWAAKMKAIGLQPSSTGMVDGKETGQRMSDYIIPNGPFTKAFVKLAAKGWKLNLQSAHRPGQKGGVNSKTKFTCSSCGLNVWGKPDADTLCTHCFLEKYPDLEIDLRGVRMLAADTVVVAAPAAPDISYDPQVAAIVPSIEPLTQNSAKRKRGRPKGSKNRKLESVEQPKPRRGRPPGSKNKRKPGRPKGSKNKPKNLPSYEATPPV